MERYVLECNTITSRLVVADVYSFWICTPRLVSRSQTLLRILGDYSGTWRRIKQVVVQITDTIMVGEHLLHLAR